MSERYNVTRGCEGWEWHVVDTFSEREPVGAFLSTGHAVVFMKMLNDQENRIAKAKHIMEKVLRDNGYGGDIHFKVKEFCQYGDWGTSVVGLINVEVDTYSDLNFKLVDHIVDNDIELGLTFYYGCSGE